MAIPRSIIALNVAALAAFGPMLYVTATRAETAARAPQPRIENNLIGFGCGPDRDATLLRADEDEFPVEGCDEIELTSGPTCFIGQRQVDPVSCRNFWGDGY